MTFFLFVISFFVPEILKFSYYANLVTYDVLGCASTVVRHKIKNICANNEAMLLKLGRVVALYKINQVVHILMLLWQTCSVSVSPSWTSNITICSCTGQNIELKVLKRRPNEGGTGLVLRKEPVFCLVESQMAQPLTSSVTKLA